MVPTARQQVVVAVLWGHRFDLVVRKYKRSKKITEVQKSRRVPWPNYRKTNRSVHLYAWCVTFQLTPAAISLTTATLTTRMATMSLQAFVVAVTTLSISAHVTSPGDTAHYAEHVVAALPQPGSANHLQELIQSTNVMTPTVKVLSQTRVMAYVDRPHVCQCLLAFPLSVKRCHHWPHVCPCLPTLAPCQRGSARAWCPTQSQPLQSVLALSC